MQQKEGLLKAKVFEFVKQIPQGKVAYFGMVAQNVGSDARTVGWILSGMPESEFGLIPWYRVVAKDGFISSLKMGYKGILQKELLLKEGYLIEDDRVNMIKHLMISDKNDLF